ncbi:cyclic nucleotide-binding domain-containing protein, partial [bacterium]|nr:cyclic nucleotide-binding domain-containing protein [bacterium]
MKNNQEFLVTSPMFAGLFDHDPGELERATQPMFVRKKQVAYRPGDPADGLYIIRTGRIKIAKITEDGREIILNLLKTGDIFGEMAFLDDAPRDTFAEALDDTNVLVIKKPELLQLIKKRPAITYRLAKII